MILLFCRINGFLQPVVSESSLRPPGWELLLPFPRWGNGGQEKGLSPVLGSQSRSESRTLTLGHKLFSKSPLGLGILILGTQSLSSSRGLAFCSGGGRDGGTQSLLKTAGDIHGSQGIPSHHARLGLISIRWEAAETAKVSVAHFPSQKWWGWVTFYGVSIHILTFIQIFFEHFLGHRLGTQYSP